jgi:GNAT superfamily N-acetyltransferase
MFRLTFVPSSYVRADHTCQILPGYFHFSTEPSFIDLNPHGETAGTLLRPHKKMATSTSSCSGSGDHTRAGTGASSNATNITCRVADLSDPSGSDGALLITLLNEYAMDIMGGGEQLEEFTRQNLVTELSKRPTAFQFFAFIDGVPAGLAVCFEGFSSFQCKPLLNIHDLVTVPQFRRRGVCSALIAHIQEFSRLKGYCKITLEVLEGNHAAKATYAKAGFHPYQLDPAMGSAMFWENKL